MDVCPNCGEYLDERATICPHCGSDEETGWKSDLDYYAVELPEEDYDERFVEALDPASSDWPGYLVVALGMGCFVWAGFRAYEWGILLPLAFLGLCAFLFALGTRERRYF